MDRLKPRAEWLDELVSGNYNSMLTSEQKEIVLPALQKLQQFPCRHEMHQNREFMECLQKVLAQQAAEQGVKPVLWWLIWEQFGISDSNLTQITYYNADKKSTKPFLTIKELFDKVKDKLLGHKDVAAMDEKRFLGLLKEIRTDLTMEFHTNGKFDDLLLLQQNPIQPPAAVGAIVPAVPSNLVPAAALVPAPTSSTNFLQQASHTAAKNYQHCIGGADTVA